MKKLKSCVLYGTGVPRGGKGIRLKLDWQLNGE